MDVLLKIHTDSVNLEGAMEQYFFQKYCNDMNLQKEDKNLSVTEDCIEAKIYAAIETAMVQAGFCGVPLTDPETLSRNIIQAALYAVGVRNHDTQKQLSDTIMDCRQNEMVKSRII